MALIGTDVNLRGALGYKGERGYNAYEIAVQNGFYGTEQDWLATIGTSSHFSRDTIIHKSTEGQTSFELPEQYTSNSLLEMYINGFKLNKDEYSLDLENKQINLIDIVLEANADVEIVILTMATNSLPIVETITKDSTNETVTGTKALYDYIEGKLLVEDIKAELDEYAKESADKAITEAIGGEY